MLRLTLPLLGESPPRTFLPRRTGLSSPPSRTPPLFARARLVPCTVVADPETSEDIAWRVAESPLFQLERHVYYRLLYFNYNQTSEVQTNSVLLRSGATTTESQSFHSTTGVSVSFESGVVRKLFTAKVTATVSRELGYATETSVAQLEEKEVSTSINTALGKATALWQEYSHYVLLRHDGATRQTVREWELGSDSYVTDEYPN